MTVISQHAVDVAAIDRAAGLAFFLLDNGPSIYGIWRGRMSAADQRKLFGRFFGKGLLTVDGSVERVRMTVKRCFGLDFETTVNVSWAELGRPS